MIGALTLDLTDVLLYRTAELSYAFVVSRLEKSVTVQEIKDLPTERVQLLLWDGIGPRLNVIPEVSMNSVFIFGWAHKAKGMRRRREEAFYASAP